LRIIHINYFALIRSGHTEHLIINPKVEAFARKDQNQLKADLQMSHYYKKPFIKFVIAIEKSGVG